MPWSGEVRNDKLQLPTDGSMEVKKAVGEF
jgi:hypothetical protein